MQKMCALCKKKVFNFLEHIFINHEISSAENYLLKVKEEEDKRAKIRAFLLYTEELTVKHRAGKISDSQFRELRAKWEKDNNLVW